MDLHAPPIAACVVPAGGEVALAHSLPQTDRDLLLLRCMLWRCAHPLHAAFRLERALAFTSCTATATGCCLMAVYTPLDNLTGM